MNAKDSIEKNRNLSEINLESWVLDKFPLNKLAGEKGEYGGISLKREINAMNQRLYYDNPVLRSNKVPLHCKSILLDQDESAATTATESLLSSLISEEEAAPEKFCWREDSEMIVFFYKKELELLDDVGKIKFGLQPTSPAGYDGTFYTVRDIPYEQLFSMCVYKTDPNDSSRGLSIPVVMAFLKGRKATDYINLLNFIKEVFQETFGRPLKISYVIGDFECASRKAFVQVFNSNVRNCRFHAKQNFKRKIREYCHVDHYQHGDLTEFFQIMGGLIFMEASLVPFVLSKLKLHIKSYAKGFRPGLMKFLNYFENNYVKRDSYSGWNLFDYLDNDDMIHTNNMLEGVHAKLKRMSGTGRNTIKRAAEVVHRFKQFNILASCNNDFKKKNNDVIERHRLLKIRFQDILLNSQDEEWRNENVLVIAKQLNNPEEDILPVYTSL